MSKKQIGLTVGILVFLVICYLIGAWYYRNHLFRDTMVNNRSLANMTVKDAEDTFVRDLKSHQITLYEKEREEIIHAEDAGIVIDVGSQIQDLKDSQNYWAWPAHFFGKSAGDINIKVTFDNDKVYEIVDNLQCLKEENVTPPKDAYITADVSEFIIVPEVLGNQVKKKELIKSIQEAFTNNINEIDLEKEDLYYLPGLYSTDERLVNAANKANKYAHTAITYDYIYTKQTLDYATLKDWIVIDKDFKVTIDESQAGDYVAGMQREHNTMGVARHFKTAQGENVVITQGDYGWKVYYKKEKEKLLKNIKSGKTISREPVWEYKGLVREGKTEDIGKTYVEVSIDDQMVWMFVDGRCIASDSCVTGNPNPKRKAATTKGIYSITFKKTPATLTGPDAQGGHYSSDVTYWMPFNGNQGLHDAPWRKAFGGDIYKRNGSHGCVNLPFDMAKEIWDHVKAGYPVIIY